MFAVHTASANKTILILQGALEDYSCVELPPKHAKHPFLPARKTSFETTDAVHRTDS